MSAHEIIRIANELAAKGLTPTTAMIKARLTQPVPMAELLKVLSQWKQQPVAIAESELLPEAVPQPAPALTLQQLAEQLARIEQKVDRLTDLLLQQGQG
ncbi:DNA-binding protein [Aeromonas veronii]|uniref:DNA-binding protein n=1 Tax=Aeromonas veronii TaxID=654 RepID=UPI00191F3E11|nr:DNA-binding protein [Aeromonas veronii]MBL0491625.1 DNA-binding protein [Aeromonas veronii]MCC0088873.1 DNA-binding protein [Aeromonas veronii]HDX8361963.1 DNA-binding protein [Aeromonas veronii]